MRVLKSKVLRPKTGEKSHSKRARRLKLSGLARGVACVTAGLCRTLRKSDDLLLGQSLAWPNGSGMSAKRSQNSAGVFSAEATWPEKRHLRKTGRHETMFGSEKFVKKKIVAAPNLLNFCRIYCLPAV